VGTKRNRKRQHLYLSIACLMLFVGAACIPCKQLPPARENCAHLGSVDGLIIQGDFEGAMKENLDILSRPSKTQQGDAALMNLGLINAHYANPKKDYKKALGFFMRVDKEFPGSPFVEEAKIWVSVLQAFEKSKQVDLDIEEKKKELGK
jgi:hypothetical protein